MDQSQHEATAPTAQAFTNLLDFTTAVTTWAANIAISIAPVIEQAIEATNDIYATVQASYRADGAIYGDTNEGLMRWLDERSRAARLQQEAQYILDRREAVRDFTAMVDKKREATK